MKRINSVVALTALLALLSSLASCSQSGQSGAETSGAPQSSAETTSTASAETQFDPIATLDMLDGKGYEFRCLGYGGSTATYREAEYFRADELNGDVINDALYYRNSDVEDMYNVKITYNLTLKDSEAKKQMLTLPLTGDAAYDVYVNKGGSMTQYIQAETITPWNDVPHIDTAQPWYAHHAIEVHTIKNKTYGLMGDILSTNTTCCWAFLFNKKLVSDYKLESPYDVVRAGKWTIDYLSGTTKEIATDLDGDGKWTEKDFYGIGADKWATLDAWQVSFNIYGLTKDKNDVPQISFFSERTVKAFEKVYDLYYNNVGTLVNSTYAYDSVNVFAADRCIYLPIFIDYMLGDTLRGMDTDFGVLPYPMLDETQGGYSTYVHPRYGTVMLPIDVPDKNYDVIGGVVEALGATSYKYVRPAIYDTALKVKTARDEDSSEMLDLLLETRHYDLSAAFEGLGTFPFTPAKSFRPNLSTGTEFSVTSWYESVEGQAKATLEKFLEYVK